MKRMKSMLIAVSFLIIAACSNFETKQNDMSFITIIPGGLVQLSGNPIVVEGRSTTTGVSMHRILCKITCTNGAIEGGPWIDSKPIDDGKALFDIHEIMDAPFDYRPSQSTISIVSEHDQLAATIEIEIGEEYFDENGNLQTVWAGTTDEIKVLKGALDEITWAVYQENDDTFYNSYVSQDKFLTTKRSVTVDLWSSVVKLFWLPSETGAFDIKTEGFFADGTISTDTYTHFGEYLDSKMYEIQIHPAVLPNFLIEIGEGKTPVKTITYIKSGSLLKGSFEINYHDRYHEVINEFYYVNRLSGIDLLVCTGEVVSSFDIESEIVTRQEAAQVRMQHHLRTRNIISKKQKFKCNAGFPSFEEREQLINFFTSHSVWWKTNRFGCPEGMVFGLVPIVIMPGSIRYDNTSEDVLDIEFDFELAR